MPQSLGGEPRAPLGHSAYRLARPSGPVDFGLPLLVTGQTGADDGLSRLQLHRGGYVAQRVEQRGAYLPLVVFQ